MGITAKLPDGTDMLEQMADHLPELPLELQRLCAETDGKELLRLKEHVLTGCLVDAMSCVQRLIRRCAKCAAIPGRTKITDLCPECTEDANRMVDAAFRLAALHKFEASATAPGSRIAAENEREQEQMFEELKKGCK